MTYAATLNETNVSGILIPGHKYTVKLATSREEIEEALKLRFDVFNIELGEGLDSSFSTKMDEDIYDDQCDHLLVVENASNSIIGTYRMQDSTMAKEGHGFYTQNEFDIHSFPQTVLDNVVELGRACIHIDHRSGRVLYLLWRGLAKYMSLTEKRYLFGCCSITSQNEAEGVAVYNYLEERNVTVEYLAPRCVDNAHFEGKYLAEWSILSLLRTFSLDFRRRQMICETNTVTIYAIFYHF